MDNRRYARSPAIQLSDFDFKITVINAFVLK